MKIRHQKTLGLIVGSILLVMLARPTLWSLITGGIFVITGELVRIWAAGHLTRMQKLTTSGPYAYVRDPLYIGRLFLIVGLCIMGWGYSLLMLPVALGVFFLNYIPRKHKKEMTRLEVLFGDEYKNYAAYVRSLMPRMRPYPHADKHSWSFTLMWRENREQYFLLIILAICIALIVRFNGL